MLKLNKETDKGLAEFALQNGLIAKEIFDEAFAIGQSSGEGIINYLIAQNHLDEDIIADGLSKVFGLQKIEFSQKELQFRPLKEEITDVYMIQNRVIPYDVTNNILTIAVSDPHSYIAFQDVQLMSGVSDIKAGVIKLSEMEKYFDYIQTTDEFLQTVGNSNYDEDSVDKKGEQNYDYLAADQSQDNGRRTLSEDTDVIEFTDTLINNAIMFGVSDIHVEVFRESARIRYRKDGVLQEMAEFNEFLGMNYPAVTARLKILANLDISERRLPQDGAIKTAFDDRSVDLRVSVLPTVYGERVVMRILDPESANYSLDQLGIPEEDLNRLKKAVHAPQGMVLVTGPTGSGKSTTLYACLKEINEDGINIMTAEDPVEFNLKGIGQVHVKDNIGLTFAAALRSFLRQDPEVIMVGEIRDKDTCDIAIKAALTGHLVLSTLHTNDAPSTVTRLINMGIPNYLITSSLSLVLAQRLARVNCPNCKKEDPNSSWEKLVYIGFDEDEAKAIKPLKGTGCEKCLGTGVKGRRGIHEILSITPAVKEAVLAGGREKEITDAARKDGFKTMQDIGRRLVKDGTISVEEYQRILVLE
jgi:type IV pilus assembly protein PilB